MFDDETKEVGRLLAYVIAGMLALTAGGYHIAKVYAPKWQELRRTVYEESRSHVTGTNQNIGRLMLEYQTASDEAHRRALRQAILMEANEFPSEKMTPEVRAFVDSLR